MEERIRKFIEYKGISPSELADEIGVQRSNVTHVLKARNKPSFQFIEKLLHTYPELNAKWLLLGTGNMLDSPGKVTRTLFDQVTEPKTPVVPVFEEKISEEIPVVQQEVLAEPSENKETKPEMKEKVVSELADQFSDFDKPIERLIVFFKDQTFKVYHPSR